jgi:hypothetical protein
MANLGNGLLGHRLDVVIKGERGQAITGTPIHIGLGGIVLDVIGDDRQPWHIASADIARWRLDCTCVLAAINPAGWDCPELSDPERRMLHRLADEAGVAA